MKLMSGGACRRRQEGLWVCASCAGSTTHALAGRVYTNVYCYLQGERHLVLQHFIKDPLTSVDVVSALYKGSSHLSRCGVSTL